MLKQRLSIVLITLVAITACGGGGGEVNKSKSDNDETAIKTIRNATAAVSGAFINYGAAD